MGGDAGQHGGGTCTREEWISTHAKDTAVHVLHSTLDLLYALPLLPTRFRRHRCYDDFHPPLTKIRTIHASECATAFSRHDCISRHPNESASLRFFGD